MAGRIYISGSAPQSWAEKQKSRRRNRKRYRSRRNRGRGRSQNPHRQSRSAWLSWLSSEEDSLGIYNFRDYDMDWLVPATCEPIQSVYFFSGGGSLCHPRSWSSWGLPCCPWSAWAEHGPWEVTQKARLGVLGCVVDVHSPFRERPRASFSGQGCVGRAWLGLTHPLLISLPDKYYRVNLRTRQVDTVSPPYPRSIAQYWLGCPAPGHQ